MPWLDGKCFLWYNILNIASAKGTEIQDQGLYMKKILLLISVLSIAMLICSGCVIDPMQGKRPVDFPGAKWVCDNPDIFFEVRKVKVHYIIVKGDETVETYDRLTNGAIGEISISGQTTEIVVSISRGNTIYVRLRQDDVTEGDWGEDVLFRGKCSLLSGQIGGIGI